MTGREYMHKHKNRLCYKCDSLVESESNLITLQMSGRGYGSIFDMDDVTIQLCSGCIKDKYYKWFEENPELLGGYCEEYKYEDDIKELINSFPVANQEYVLNDWMDRQDWIDMKKGVLPDEKYERYGMISPRQKRAYEERFPTCEHPINVVFDDNSKSCWCPFGAHGGYNQKADKHNNITKCFGCSHYESRSNPIKEMDWNTYKRYEKYAKGKANYLKLKNEFE